MVLINAAINALKKVMPSSDYAAIRTVEAVPTWTGNRQVLYTYYSLIYSELILVNLFVFVGHDKTAGEGDEVAK